jgi:Na+-driven multidrug efflux pump
MALGGASFNRILVEYTPDAVAAHQVGMRLDHLVILPMVALSAALVTLVGMFFGAGRYDLLDDIVRYAMKRAMLIGLVISILFLTLAPWLVAIFTESAEIRSLAVKYVRTISLAYPFIPVAMLTGRALQGLGRGTPELVLTLLRVLLIALPLALLVAFVLEWPVVWVWRSMVFASWCSAAIAWFWLRAGLEDARERIVSREEIEPVPMPGPGEALA